MEYGGVPRSSDYERKLLSLRDQARVTDGWLRQRLETVLPSVMAREGFDMWIVICREYNEDQVLLTLLPATAMSARRRTMLVFSRTQSGAVERLMLSRSGGGRGGLYEGVWDPEA